MDKQSDKIKIGDPCKEAFMGPQATKTAGSIFDNICIHFEKQEYKQIFENVYCTDRIEKDADNKNIVIHVEKCSPYYKEAFTNDFFTTYKYLSFEWAEKNITNQCFPLLSPFMWRDPYEIIFLKRGNKVVPYDVFCSCMTYNRGSNEESSWNAYKQEKEPMIRFGFSLQKLLEFLKKAAATPNYSDFLFYVTLIDYNLKKKEIQQLAKMFWETYSSVSEQDMINLLSIKRSAFRYEGEIRIIAIRKKEKETQEVMSLEMNYVQELSEIMLGPYPPLRNNDKNLNIYDTLQEERNKYLQEKLTTALDSNIQGIFKQCRLYQPLY